MIGCFITLTMDSSSPHVREVDIDVDAIAAYWPGGTAGYDAHTNIALKSGREIQVREQFTDVRARVKALTA